MMTDFPVNATLSHIRMMDLRVSALVKIAGDARAIDDRHRYKLAGLLGYPSWEALKRAHWRDDDVSAKITDQLRSITGPYGDVMLKILEARFNE